MLGPLKERAFTRVTNVSVEDFVPPEVILVLAGMLSDEQYYKLLDQTPSLADVTARQHTSGR